MSTPTNTPELFTQAHSPLWLPPIQGLHRRDPEHVYYLNGMAFPVSITGVLGLSKSDFAMARIEATRPEWEPRGNAAHRALELALTLACVPSPPEGLAGELEALAEGPHAEWVGPLITHPRWHEVQIIASERATCCPRRRVAGQYDCAFLADDLPIPADRPAHITGPARVLADLKSLSANGSTYSTAGQLGGYMALEAHWGHWYDYGQTIWARPGITTFSPLYSRSDCLTAWAAAWARYRATPPARGIKLK